MKKKQKSIQDLAPHICEFLPQNVIKRKTLNGLKCTIKIVRVGSAKPICTARFHLKHEFHCIYLYILATIVYLQCDVIVILDRFAVATIIFKMCLFNIYIYIHIYIYIYMFKYIICLLVCFILLIITIF